MIAHKWSVLTEYAPFIMTGCAVGELTDDHERLQLSDSLLICGRPWSSSRRELTKMDLNEIMEENTSNTLALTMDNHDPYDEFGWVQGWRFALCDFLTFKRGENVPKFRPASHPDESYEFETLVYENPETEDLWNALLILDAYREWLGDQGKDY